MTCVCGLQRKVHLRVNAFFLWARSPSPRPHAALPGSGVSNSALLPRLAPCEQTDGASSPPSVSLGTSTQRQPTGLQGWGCPRAGPAPAPLPRPRTATIPRALGVRPALRPPLLQPLPRAQLGVASRGRTLKSFLLLLPGPLSGQRAPLGHGAEPRRRGGACSE